ncbi:hypothetical protein GW781_11420 [bacterium]|nr:hypothetical protein [bacterium]NCT21750.1 hypothetical protein [bacterium]OIO86421.1 MAG: hypothetical protein AUK01_03255 [Anaerolineae bacterium CG2_30_57_67]
MDELEPETQKIILQEIEKWRKERLISDAGAAALSRRYQPPASQPAPQPLPAAVVPPAPRPSLMQTLTSESSIKTFLYLGAFFVLASAFILGMLLDFLRLPILLITDFLFAAATFQQRKRLPQASFILWLVTTGLAWIIFSVVADLLNLQGQIISLYWLAVFFLLTAVFVISIWLYRSRFFSLAAYLTLSLAAWNFAAFFQQSETLPYLILGLANLVALIGVALLQRWQNRAFAWPLLALAQLSQAALLISSFVTMGIYLLEPAALRAWLPLAALWAMAAIFYVFSNLIIPFPLFPFFAALALIPLPWLVLQQFEPINAVYAFGWWGWGLFLAILAEGALFFKSQRLRVYAQALSLASLPLLLIGSAWPFLDGNTLLAFGLLTVSSLFLTALHLRENRWWVWSVALLAGTSAYLTFFNLDAIAHLKISLLFQFTGLTVLLSLLDGLLPGNFFQKPAWRWPLRFFNTLTVFTMSAAALFDGGAPGNSALAFGVLALIGLAYGLRFRAPLFGWLFTGYLALTVLFGLQALQQTLWVFALMGLAALYCLPGWGMLAVKIAPRWGQVLLNSGLALATLTALSAPQENSGLIKAIPVTVAALLWTMEAFRRRNVWLGFPANGLYLLAYFIILNELRVNEPQFFSIGAALLGLLMHYLLARAGSDRGAFFTGLLSQLILLGTTYIQMLANEQLGYFAALFFQSLIVLFYGLIFRSRSLVSVPVAFVVLGVVTVVFRVLDTFLLIVMIGCTGIIFLLVGTAALRMREKISTWRKKLSDWHA